MGIVTEWGHDDAAARLRPEIVPPGVICLGDFCVFAVYSPMLGAWRTTANVVEAPSTTHEVSVRKLSAWLEGGGKRPRERATKVHLRELLGRR